MSALLLAWLPVTWAQLDDSDDPTFSHHPLWAVLKKSQIAQRPPDFVYRADNPAEVRALAGRDLEISGFIIPLESSAKSRHFILSRYSPDCPFCPQGMPNEMVEVVSNDVVAMQGVQLVTLRGRFRIEASSDAGLFFRLDGANLL